MLKQLFSLASTLLTVVPSAAAEPLIVHSVYEKTVDVRLDTEVQSVIKDQTFLLVTRRNATSLTRALINVGEISITDAANGKLQLSKFTCADGTPVQFYAVQSCLGSWEAGDHLEVQVQLTFNPPSDETTKKPSLPELATGSRSVFYGYKVNIRSLDPSGKRIFASLQFGYDQNGICTLKQETTRVAALMNANKNHLAVKPKLDKSSRLPAQSFKVQTVTTNGVNQPNPGDEAGVYIEMELEERLPVLTKDYSVTLSLPESLLVYGPTKSCDGGATPQPPSSSEAPQPTVSISLPDQTGVPAENRLINADLTFTSYVKPFNEDKAFGPANNGERRNVGLLSLTIAKRHNLLPRGETHPWTLDLNLKHHSDVSTLPAREADTPTQIANDVGLLLGRAPLNAVTQFLIGVGGHHESDRDFKLQIATARFTFSPTFRGFDQNRAYRKASRTRNAVSTFRLVPTFGYEVGGVGSDRRGTSILEQEQMRFDNGVRRFTTDIDFSLEFNERISFNASNSTHYVQRITRRPVRNYLDANMTFDLHELFHTRALASFDTGLVVKFQRGEQAPLYTPVNVFSLGIKILR